jgi:hypothetical protein
MQKVMVVAYRGKEASPFEYKWNFTLHSSLTQLSKTQEAMEIKIML